MLICQLAFDRRAIPTIVLLIVGFGLVLLEGRTALVTFSIILIANLMRYRGEISASYFFKYVFLVAIFSVLAIGVILDRGVDLSNFAQNEARLQAFQLLGLVMVESDFTQTILGHGLGVDFSEFFPENIMRENKHVIFQMKHHGLGIYTSFAFHNEWIRQFLVGGLLYFISLLACIYYFLGSFLLFLGILLLGFSNGILGIYIVGPVFFLVCGWANGKKR